MNTADTMPVAQFLIAESLMEDFAERTGVTGNRPPKRYLWTDAFAVCNFLELYRETKMEKFLVLAQSLIDQVHLTLGRHREDDIRKGWISGLSEDEGVRHPTAGGLRIGKALPERLPGDPHDELREWDQDGQYYHYLTKWMHALYRTGHVTGSTEYFRLALELARTAHAHFTYRPAAGSPKRMYWKMSIDLTRPLVHSMGYLDPLDGLITYYELNGPGRPDDSFPEISEEILDMIPLCVNRDWITDDSLGLGGLLTDAWRLAQLVMHKVNVEEDLLADIVSSCRESLEFFLPNRMFSLDAGLRLAFRELGLSIGFHAVEKLYYAKTQNPAPFNNMRQLNREIEKIFTHRSIAESLEDFWLEADHQNAKIWLEHQDINCVMLATSLLPDEFLTV